MKNILFVHQSAELYGSDKVLHSLVAGLNRERFSPIVLLPNDGPLVRELESDGVDVRIVPITRLSRSTLTISGLARLPLDIARSVRTITHSLRGVRIDLVHSNTLAVLSGAMWARWNRVPHIWHVHEMIERPWMVKTAYGFLLTLFADHVPCNSTATQAVLVNTRRALSSKTTIIWNGLDRATPVNTVEAAEIRRRFNVPPGAVLVLLMGRINRWKGQKLLVEAANVLAAKGLSSISFLIVGSAPPGQQHFVSELMHVISTSSVAANIHVLDFQESIWPLWDACDIAVVPSTEPEPFGMVALEAMAARKPVIAAAHGGLVDIVADGTTGILVTPNDANALAQAIARLAGDVSERSRMGQAGWETLRKQFTTARYIERFEELYGRAQSN